MANLRDQPAGPPVFEPEQHVLVRPVAAWPGRLTGPKPKGVPAQVLHAQVGDCYLVRYAGGGLDVVHASRMLDANLAEDDE